MKKAPSSNVSNTLNSLLTLLSALLCAVIGNSSFIVDKCLSSNVVKISLYDWSCVEAKDPASNNKSVTPPRAETTKMIGSLYVEIIFFILTIFSGLATDEPPNFRTFMLLKYWLCN